MTIIYTLPSLCQALFIEIFCANWSTLHLFQDPMSWNFANSSCSKMSIFFLQEGLHERPCQGGCLIGHQGDMVGDRASWVSKNKDFLPPVACIAGKKSPIRSLYPTQPIFHEHWLLPLMPTSHPEKEGKRKISLHILLLVSLTARLAHCVLLQMHLCQ